MDDIGHRGCQIVWLPLLSSVISEVFNIFSRIRVQRVIQELRPWCVFGFSFPASDVVEL